MRFGTWFGMCIAGVMTLTGSQALVSGAESDFKVRKHENWGYADPDWTIDVPGWAAPAPGEHPRLVFRKADLPRHGYATKTTEVTLAGKKAYVMTLQKGEPPQVRQDGETVVVGGQVISFDGRKLILNPAPAR